MVKPTWQLWGPSSSPGRRPWSRRWHRRRATQGYISINLPPPPPPGLTLEGGGGRIFFVHRHFQFPHSCSFYLYHYLSHPPPTIFGKLYIPGAGWRCWTAPRTRRRCTGRSPRSSYLDSETSFSFLVRIFQITILFSVNSRYTIPSLCYL